MDLKNFSKQEYELREDIPRFVPLFHDRFEWFTGRFVGVNNFFNL